MFSEPDTTTSVAVGIVTGRIASDLRQQLNQYFPVSRNRIWIFDDELLLLIRLGRADLVEQVINLHRRYPGTMTEINVPLTIEAALLFVNNTDTVTATWSIYNFVKLYNHAAAAKFVQAVLQPGIVTPEDKHKIVSIFGAIEDFVSWDYVKAVTRTNDILRWAVKYLARLRSAMLIEAEYCTAVSYADVADYTTLPAEKNRLAYLNKIWDDYAAVLSNYKRERSVHTRVAWMEALKSLTAAREKVIREHYIEWRAAFQLAKSGQTNGLKDESTLRWLLDVMTNTRFNVAARDEWSRTEKPYVIKQLSQSALSVDVVETVADIAAYSRSFEVTVMRPLKCPNTLDVDVRHPDGWNLVEPLLVRTVAWYDVTCCIPPDYENFVALWPVDKQPYIKGYLDWFEFAYWAQMYWLKKLLKYVPDSLVIRIFAPLMASCVQHLAFSIDGGPPIAPLDSRLWATIQKSWITSLDSKEPQMDLSFAENDAHNFVQFYDEASPEVRLVESDGSNNALIGKQFMFPQTRVLRGSVKIGSKPSEVSGLDEIFLKNISILLKKVPGCINDFLALGLMPTPVELNNYYRGWAKDDTNTAWWIAQDTQDNYLNQRYFSDITTSQLVFNEVKWAHKCQNVSNHAYAAFADSKWDDSYKVPAYVQKPTFWEYWQAVIELFKKQCNSQKVQSDAAIELWAQVVPTATVAPPT